MYNSNCSSLCLTGSHNSSSPHHNSSSGQSDRFHQSALDSPCQVSQRRDSACFLGPDIGHSYSQMGDPLFNCRQGHVFMVRTKPSKQPLGLVAHGVPIEKVRAKRAMHSDWGGPTLDKAMYFWVELSPRNNPSDWSCMEFH